MTRKTKKGEFDWESVNMLVFNPKRVPIPEGAEARMPRIANALYVGIIPKTYTEKYVIDGIKISKTNVGFNIKATDNRIPTLKEPFCLIIELDKETIQFIELDDMLDASELKILEEWVTNENEILLKIANEYEQYDRQFYHFMYDIIGISKAITKWPSEDQNELLNETKTAIGLLHNRIHAEIFSDYKSNGTIIKLFSLNPNNNKKPDLEINNTFVDIKAILLTGRYYHKLLKHFKNRIQKILEKEQENNQIGIQGTFFVAVWSGVVSSIFYEVFNKMKTNPIFAGIKIYDKVPPFEKQKVIFVVPSPNAFENYYLVVNRNRAVRIASYIEKEGYDKIQKKDAISYLSIINVRKGCPFGVTGSMPMIMFKLT
ncbi:MAG: hypothetical protein GKS07_01955 [Nitrosopumilus sp.]|nr:MAG: hypothetical protein GKS07_01955 [Nitrosopumilus sp.]